VTALTEEYVARVRALGAGRDAVLAAVRAALSGSFD